MIKEDLSNFSIDDLEEVDGTKLMLQDDVAADEVMEWVRRNAQDVNRLMRENGALLIRRLRIQGSKKLEAMLAAFFGEELLEYTYRSTPRTKMRGRIYTSSEYPPDEPIFLHNENAYSNKWPRSIAFYCVQPSETGGATPIADSRIIYREIPEEIRKEFESRKLLYVRNYGDIDLPWTEVFQTHDKDQVEAYCRQNHIEFEWKDGNRLRTRQTNSASCRHPRTGEKIWFNQAHMFHLSAHGREVQESLLSMGGMEHLPRNVYFGDQGIIPDDMLDAIRKVYLDNEIVFQWQEHDLILLDNMLYCHGRRPYSGSRRVLTGMAGSLDMSTNS